MARRASKKQPSFLKSLWSAVRSQSLFVQISLLIIIIVTLSIPVFITQQLVWKNHAEIHYYVSETGVGENSIFSQEDPVISDLTPTSVTINWNTNATSRAEVKYWPDNFLYGLFPFLPTPSIIDPEVTTNHSLTILKHLSPGRRYLYKIISHTEDDESFTSKYYTFTTPKS